MNLLGLDVGSKRIGVAKASSSVKIAVPVGMIEVNGDEFKNIVRLVKLYNIDVVVVGMPRNLSGALTQQSDYVKNFVKTLNQVLLAEKPNQKTVKIFLQDESLTSVEARQNLKNKKGGIDKKAGDVDAEAATLILQDFLENLARRAEKLTGKSSKTFQIPSEAQKSPSLSAESPKPPKDGSPEPKPQFKPYRKDPTKKWRLIRLAIILVAVLALIFFGVRAGYNFLISPLVTSEKCGGVDASSDANPCRLIEVTVPDGATSSEIADLLASSGVIRSALGFKIYVRLNNISDLKSGTYQLSATASVAELVEKLQAGSNTALVFRFTSLPGETISDIKKRLTSIGYSSEEVEATFAKNYTHPVLADKPADASLEGYLFGETYEFYTSDSVETIITRMLDELYIVVQKNNLISKFNSMGLTLHEGIILASIVQKEAGTLSKDDQKTVAQIFLSRLELGVPLGSDVTVKYALDQVDPDRTTYADNASALEIDSCYNTRKNAGLPCGPISNPSSLVLISTANPSDTSYLYFLTGDDGLMYYSNTEAEHIQNIYSHCQTLCNTSL